MPRSEIVQARIRPELKRDVEALKRPSGLSWQRLLEQLLEAWVATQQSVPSSSPPSLPPADAPPLPVGMGQMTMPEVQAWLSAAAARGAPIIVLHCPAPLPPLPEVADGAAAPVPDAPPPAEVLPAFTCHKCHHTWTPRQRGRPTVCPKCKNTHWWQARQRRRRPDPS